MHKNAIAYTILFAIHTHLVQKHHVPPYISESYRLTVSHVLPFYRHNPSLVSQLQKSIPIRNKVCHFVSISPKELNLIEHLGRSFHINQSKKVGIRR